MRKKPFKNSSLRESYKNMLQGYQVDGRFSVPRDFALGRPNSGAYGR